MNTFNKGDKVRVVRDTKSTLGTILTKGLEGLVENVSLGQGDVGVRLAAQGTRFQGLFGIPRSALELAPPVKAGDTVTVLVKTTDHAGEFSVTGKVYRHSPYGPDFVGGHALAHEHTTLTAHQPAPMPEWKPGTFGTATVNPSDDGPVTAKGVVGHDGMFACVTTGAHIVGPGEWSDFVPDSVPEHAEEVLRRAVSNTLFVLGKGTEYLPQVEKVVAESLKELRDGIPELPEMASSGWANVDRDSLRNVLRVSLMFRAGLNVQTIPTDSELDSVVADVLEELGL